MKTEVYSYTRWSTAEQTMGDSERRQLQQAEAWCDRKGLKLSARTFADKGISAKAGKNLEAGALGELVKVAKAGDVLLIEDNDRFSRQDPITALSNLRTVAQKGISVVFLRTGVEVNRDNFNDMSVIVPNFFGALLANQENEKKAYRVRESWVKRRELLRSGQACGMKLPGWLAVVGKPGRNQAREVRINQDKAAIVVRIFKLALEGWSSRRIAEHLNERGVATISGQKSRKTGKPAKWNGYSLLACVLRNPQVMGHVTVDGEVIKGIYPAVIDEKTYYAAQRNVDTNRKQPTRQISQCLVTGLVFCPACGGAMSHHTNRHTKTGKTYRYLLCSANKAGQSTNPDCARRVSYPLVEQSLLALLSQSEAVKNALGQAKSEPTKLAALRGQVADANRLAEKYLRAFETEDAGPLALRRSNECSARAEALLAELQAEERKAAATTSPQKAYGNFLAELAKKVSYHNLCMEEYREHVKVTLRDIIERIDIRGDRTSYVVTFKGGAQHTVAMASAPVELSKVKFAGATPALP